MRGVSGFILLPLGTYYREKMESDKSPVGSLPLFADVDCSSSRFSF
jgi:hypothetical protein